MQLNPEDWTAIWLTIKLATVTTILLLAVATPIAWWLFNLRSRWRSVIQVVVTLPLILPPTVLGFYLLVILGPTSMLGELTQLVGLDQLIFSFSGLVFASMIYSLPFAVQPLLNAFESMGDGPLEVAATLRAGPLDRFFHVALPMAKPGMLTAMLLVFAHTIGEFGVVMMIGGSIPGETKVASIQIYEHVELMQYSQAHFLSACLIGFAVIMLLLIYRVNNKTHSFIEGKQRSGV